MTHKALVIDDDPDILEAVGDTLRSLGHEHDDATCQEEARELLSRNQYSYYLVDLEIPVRAGGGFSRIQNGENLVAEIVQRRGAGQEPVIIMTGHGTDRPSLAVRMMKLGAADYVTKPFPSTGNTLDNAIREALARSRCRDDPRATDPAGLPGRPAEPRPFTGGELGFFQYRVELCGAKVLGGQPDALMRRILVALRPKRASGKFVAYSGHELAAKVGCPGEVNRVAGAIRDFRQETMRILLGELNLQCGPQDVIQSGGPGYRYKEWIVVRDGETGVMGPSRESCGTLNGTLKSADGTVNGTLNDGDGTLNDHAGTVNGDDGVVNDPAERRRQWILAELGKGRQLRVPTIAAELRCSQRTVRRDLDFLRAEGKIEYVGPSRSGYY